MATAGKVVYRGVRLNQQSPIFAKTEAFMVWLLEHTRKFPKYERFRLQQQIDNAIFAFHDSIIRAVQTEDTLLHLQEADIQLTKLRTYLRVAVEMKHTSHKQFQYASRQTTELGKLLGAWKKKA